ncbi:unknown [Dialister sp. CAG:357]|nr:unknown [Dialister sp. CAG:357]
MYAVPAAEGCHFRIDGVESIQFVHISAGVVGGKACVLVLSSPFVIDAVCQAAGEVPFAVGFIAIGFRGCVPHAYVDFSLSLLVRRQRRCVCCAGNCCQCDHSRNNFLHKFHLSQSIISIISKFLFLVSIPLYHNEKKRLRT